jgi:Ni,Fe-hydrogenase III component G
LNLALGHRVAIVPVTPRPASGASAGGAGATSIPATVSVTDDLLVNLAREDLNPAIAALQGLGARHLMLVAFDLGSVRRKAGLAVEEAVAVPNGPIVRLRIELPADDPSYPSITPLVPAAQWDEREAHDLHGVVPVGHPDPRPLVSHEPPAAPAAPFRSFVAHGEGVY